MRTDSAAPRPEFLTLSTESAVCGAAELFTISHEQRTGR